MMCLFICLCAIVILFGFNAYLLAKRQKSLRYFASGGVCFLAGGVIEALPAVVMALPTNIFVQNAFYVGIALEVLFFLVALMHKVNVHQREKYLSCKQVLQQTKEDEQWAQEQNKRLEQKVEERTQDLKQAFEELQSLNEEIMAQHNQLETHHLLLSQSIRAAQNIQQATLPFDDHISKIISEYFILFRPRNIVSGDFYWIEEVDGYKFVIAVDCTGHGIPGAFMSMVANTLLDNIIKVNKVFEPAQILELLDQKVKTCLQQDKTNDRNGMDVALVVLKENGDTVDVQFAGARRPLYYLENNTLKAIKGSRKTIGGIFNKRVFESHQLTLAKGTMLYLGSDGLADQNSLHQHKLGSAFLQEFLEGNANLPVSDQKDKLEDLLEKHMYGVEQRDDILWMGVKI